MYHIQINKCHLTFIKTVYEKVKKYLGGFL